MGEKGSWVLQRWLRDELARDVPLDTMVRQIVTGLGSTWQNPPASFYRTNRDPTTAAESVGQVFLGIRLQCARCHNHPFDVWTQDDYYGLAAFFANVARKQPSNVRKDRLDLHEINGDEIIYLSGRAEMVQPRTGTLLHPKCLNGPTLDRAAGDDGNALEMLADWLTRNNPQFSRNLANRVWFHLLGRGIVDPVDDFRESNPPSNPALLDAVTAHFEAERDAAQAAGRLDHEVADLPVERDTEPDQRRRRGEFLARGRPAAAGRGAARRDQPGRRGARTISACTGIAAGRPAPGRLRRRRVPEDVRQARPAPDLRVRAVRVDDAGPGVPDDQRRDGAQEAGVRSNRIGSRLDAGRSDSEILDEVYLAAARASRRRPSERPCPCTFGGARIVARPGKMCVWALLNSKEFLLRH